MPVLIVKVLDLLNDCVCTEGELLRNMLRSSPMLLFMLLMLLMAGCMSSPARTLLPGASEFKPQADTMPVNAPVSTTGCGHNSPVAAGVTVTMTIAAQPAESEGSSTRTYLLHLPRQYDDTLPLAVVLAFHGHGGSAAGMEQTSGFSSLADQQRFIAVYPQGLVQRFSTRTFWADIGPIDDGVDDVLYVSNILNDLQKTFCVDAHRMYATGFSNGGGMTILLACRLAGRIAAFAPISADSYTIPGGCHPGRPVPFLDIHGTADALLHYNGGSSGDNTDWPFPALPQFLRSWATRDGCTSGPLIFLQQQGQAGQPGVTGMQWTGCQGNVRVVHYRINGGGHQWPPAIEGHTPAEILWQFFRAYPLP